MLQIYWAANWATLFKRNCKEKKKQFNIYFVILLSYNKYHGNQQLVKELLIVQVQERCQLYMYVKHIFF